MKEDDKKAYSPLVMDISKLTLEDILGYNGIKISGYSQDVSDDGERTVTFYAVPTKRNRKCANKKCDCMVYKHGTNHRVLKDLDLFDARTLIDVEVARYKCPECGKTQMDDISELAMPNQTMTNRLREKIARDGARFSFTQSALWHHISKAEAKNVFNSWADYLEKTSRKVVAPRRLGIDETHLGGKGQRGMRGVLVDLENSLLLDILPDKSPETIVQGIKNMEDWRNIKIVSIDMSTTYRTLAYKTIPGVTVVVDHFHVIQLLIKRMREARAFIVNEAGNPSLGNNHNLMKINLEDLTPKQKEELMTHFAMVPELGTLYALKESFRSIYFAEYSPSKLGFDEPTRKEAEEAYERWIKSIPEVKPLTDEERKSKRKHVDRFEPIRQFAKTVDMWHKEIFAYFDVLDSNSTTEALNGLIKIVNRNGRGYEFNTLRHKLLYGLQLKSLPVERVYELGGKTTAKVPVNDYIEDIGFARRQLYTMHYEQRKFIKEDWNTSIDELMDAVKDGSLYIGEDDYVEAEDD